MRFSSLNEQNHQFGDQHRHIRIGKFEIFFLLTFGLYRKSHLSRSSITNFANVSRSLTSHTISSAVKNDYSHRETQEKLRELAVPGEVKHVVPIDKTAGRRPFVVRHVSLVIEINLKSISYFLG